MNSFIFNDLGQVDVNVFLNTTKDIILNRMLTRTNDSLDKTPDSLVYDASATSAVEHAQVYIELYRIYASQRMDLALGDDLVRLAADRGVIRREASQSTVLVRLTPSNITLTQGMLFSSSVGSFIVSGDSFSEGVYPMTSVDTGSRMNISSGFLIPNVYVNGLESAEVISLIAPARDIESYEELRTRGMESYGFQPYGGNNVYYRRVVGDLPQVGAVKVHHVSAGYVDIFFLDNALNVPSEELIAAIQTIVDPLPGEGEGLATIGAKVTVKAPEEVTVNVVTNVQYPINMTDEQAKELAVTVYDEIVLRAREQWEAERGVSHILRIEEIESALYMAGFVDVNGTTLNGAAQNITIPANSILKGGTIEPNKIS